MKNIFVSVISILITIVALGQKKPGELQIMPFVRFDWYPEFSYNVNGRPSTDFLKMRGISPGLFLNYKHSISNNFIIIAGSGFYKYSFIKLTNRNTQFGTTNSRPIKYPSMIDFGWRTNSYNYKCISFNLGIEKSFKIKKELNLNAGISYSLFLTFNQAYKLRTDDITYRKTDKQLFAQTIFAYIGFEKKLKNIGIVPKLLIPVYDKWHKDEVFFSETDSETRNKWLNGLGIGFEINLPLKK